MGLWVPLPPGPSPRAHQGEAVVDLHQLLGLVLLEDDDAVQGPAAAPGAALAVHQVGVAPAGLARHEEDVEHLHLRHTAQRWCSRVRPPHPPSPFGLHPGPVPVTHDEAMQKPWPRQCHGCDWVKTVVKTITKTRTKTTARP